MTFSMTLGLAVTFQNFKTLLVLAYFFYVSETVSTETNSGIHQSACRSCGLITPLFFLHYPSFVTCSIKLLNQTKL